MSCINLLETAPHVGREVKMSSINQTPTPYRYSYTYQRLADGWYHSKPFQSLDHRLPVKLAIEPVIRYDYQDRGAEVIIHGQKINGQWEFFSGLLSTCERGYKRGDHLRLSKGQAVKSLFIVNQVDSDNLNLIYYPNFWISDTTKLEDFVCNEVEMFRQTISNG